jgi:hypothetical protein
MTTQGVVGSIVSLWRYPVKSMMGEELNATEVAKIGLLGDRAYSLVDSSDAKVASAKNPRKWPQLFDFRAALADAPRTGVKLPSVRITLPDGTIVASDQPDIDRIPIPQRSTLQHSEDPRRPGTRGCLFRFGPQSLICAPMHSLGFRRESVCRAWQAA